MSQAPQAKTLLDLRRRQGLTVRQMGVDQAHYVQIEHARRSPGPRALQKMATALGVECAQVWDAWLATEAAAVGAEKSKGRAHAPRRSKARAS